MKKRFLVVVAFSICTVLSCDQSRTEHAGLFRLLNNKEIGIDFINQLSYDRNFNVYKYRNYYNGGGVALGDINNDGLLDIYFTANLLSNKLYLNKGGNQFEDITNLSQTGGDKSWSTGVTMVDINADGLLDIYVCNSGDISGDNKENELFINNGDNTFTEQAAEYGLNDSGYSTHISFFDYDKDGDLDAYMLNNSYQAIGSFNLRINERENRDKKGGDKLLRNDGDKFVDVSETAGIYGSVIGFGLGVTVGDVNNDNWEDIYVSNDFFERDYLYINQKDGTFIEELPAQINSISGASMGADMADINNDGHADIFVTEMLPSDPVRLKTVTTFESWNKYQYSLNNGYHHQFTRNMLQVNNGDDSFSELGRLAGVEASDWSWGALFFDMDNDGLKDLFVANGIYQDLTDQDYLQYVANEEVIKSVIQDSGVNYKTLIDIIPSNPVPNHFYLNKTGIKFEKILTGDEQAPSFSNGAAYGDLDNDGDLDLVINNVNMPVFIYENRTEKTDNNHISITLKGEKQNTFAIGSKIEITSDNGQSIVCQVQPSRGFQSSVDPKNTIGIGKVKSVDVKITWPDQSTSILKDQAANSTITINKDDNQSVALTTQKEKVNTVFQKTEALPLFHEENSFVDFNRERLIYHMRSNESPALSSSDLDGDGIPDIVITGSKGQSSRYFSSERKRIIEFTDLENYRETEHTAVEIFDADGDGDLDVYLASGGVDVSRFSPSLYDHLLFNDGKGNFTLSKQQFPTEGMNISSSVVISHDYDSDGDLDLFVGERIKIGCYGQKCDGYLLENDGIGNFKDVTTDIIPDVKEIGMITDAEYSDIDGDGNEELVIVGEFMNPHIFKLVDGGFVRIENEILESLKGWYTCMAISDWNGDGLNDIVLGNHGLNSRFKASADNPMRLYTKDYDKNGFPETVITTERSGKDYPLALRHNLIDQLKYLKKRFPDYQSYKDASITDIFTEEELEGVEIQEANTLESLILINTGNFTFEVQTLPEAAQISPIYSIASHDFDNDGDEDLLLGGNNYKVLPEAGIYDASFGVYLENDGAASFTPMKASQSGIKIKGQIRDFLISDNKIHVAINNDSLQCYSF